MKQLAQSELIDAVALRELVAIAWNAAPFEGTYERINTPGAM
jgi:hypothetical protein